MAFFIFQNHISEKFMISHLTFHRLSCVPLFPKIVFKINNFFKNDKFLIPSKGRMSADISERKMANTIQLKWTFLALKRAVFCLKIASDFSKKATPANSKQNLNIIQL